MIPLSTDAQAALHMLAYQFLTQHKTAKALPLLEFLVANKPGDPGLRLTLAYALLRSGRAADAVDLLAALQFSSEAAVHFMRGKAFAQAGMTEQARNAFIQYRLLRFPAAQAAPPAGHAAPSSAL